jgi:NADH-quinone oxidoreductase subunit L
MAASAAIAIIGIGLAWWFYVGSPRLPGLVAAAIKPLYAASANKFFFDEVYRTALVAPLRGLAWLSYWFDRRVIDPLVDIVGMMPRLVSSVPLVFHNGVVPSYALVMWTGLIVCVLFALGLLP